MSDAAPINPYEPPAAINRSKPTIPTNANRAWRDGVLVVVCFDKPGVVCDRCVFSGVKVGPADRRKVELTYTPLLRFSETRSVSLPAVPETRGTLGSISTACQWVTISSVLGLVATVASAAYFRGNPRPYVGLLLAWFVAGIVSAFIRQRIEQTPLSIFRVVGSYGWVQGAHADFLRELPPWPGGDPQ